METASYFMTALTMASILSTGALTLHLTEKYGNLKADGKAVPQDPGNKLRGDFANAVFAMSIVVIILAGIYIIMWLWSWVKKPWS